MSDWEDVPASDGWEEVPADDTTRKVARIVGQGAQGVNDSLVADLFGAPVDLVSKGLRKIGVPIQADPIGGSESIKKGIDYVATLPGRIHEFTDILSPKAGTLTDNRTSRFEPATRGEKIARGVGEGAGTALSVALPAAGVARLAAPGGLLQGVSQTLAAQPVGQAIAGGVGGGVTEATSNPYLGAAASIATPIAASIARRVISPVQARLLPQEQNIVAAADREGIPLTPAQRTGSPNLQAAEEVMARMPLANGPMRDTFTQQRQAFNRATLDRAGVTANDASPDTMAHAFDNIGQRFEDLVSRTTVDLNGRAGIQFARDIGHAANEYGRRLPTDVAPVFNSYMRDVAPIIQQIGQPGANPALTGEFYQNIRSGLARRIREAQNGDLRRALGGVAEAFDNAMENSTSGALRQEWREARRQYQALKTIDTAVSGGTQAARAAGDVPFSSLRTAVRQGDKEGYGRGRGQLNELSRVGDYIAGKVPNSGTPERGMWQKLLTGGGLFSAMAGGTAATGGGLLPAIGVGAAAAATPYALSRFYNSAAGRAYLANQLAGRTNMRAQYGSQALQSIPGLLDQ